MVENEGLHGYLRGSRFRSSQGTWIWNKHLGTQWCNDQREPYRENQRASEERHERVHRSLGHVRCEVPWHIHVVVSGRRLQDNGSRIQMRRGT